VRELLGMIVWMAPVIDIGVASSIAKSTVLACRTGWYTPTAVISMINVEGVSTDITPSRIWPGSVVTRMTSLDHVRTTCSNRAILQGLIRMRVRSMLLMPVLILPSHYNFPNLVSASFGTVTFLGKVVLLETVWSSIHVVRVIVQVV